MCNDSNVHPQSNPSPSEIPTEIVSEAEMALIETALAAAATLSYSSSHIRRLPSGRMLSGCSSTQTARDIEDLSLPARKRVKSSESLLKRFRKKRGLMVTDITAAEWCEKQMEFTLLYGRPKRTHAMKAGCTRHAELEEEIVKRVEVSIQSAEDSWAVKLMNFIAGANQLLFDGLTREIPVVGVVQGVWTIGVIDEIRMSVSESVKHPLLVDTKTRSRPTLPSVDQKRNARFQLMCYKYLWDNLVTNDFPSTHFFDFFGLDPQCTLSCDVRNRLAESGLNSKTFGELVKYFSDTCHLLPLANEQLLLRYEYQADQSLLGEDQFPYDPNWVKSQMEWCLKFWMGEREANYVSNGEEWKCRFCSFSSKCLMGNQTKKLEDGGQQKCPPSTI
ncbi:exonuclease V, chloroplastic-like [Aristolochia californica]|uniref:exonuclease V, chloroplastic-like n=1 Tax=Aristolochia californica TaxID=171875 RepID=UPI0035DB8C7B